MQYGDYCTQIGPDGSGHDRCAAAVLASAMLSFGWDSDPWELTQQVATETGIADRGATVEQLVEAAQHYGLVAGTWVTWEAAVTALASGQVVAALLNNVYLYPRSYPAGHAWEALHWIRLRSFLPDDALLLCYDPLTYVQQQHGDVYQGPWLYDLLSVREAIKQSPVEQAGVVFAPPIPAPSSA